MRDDHGNVALIFSLSLVPILAVLGAAVDYATLVSRRTQMRAAADSAALTAATVASAAYAGGSASWKADAAKAARATFAAGLKNATTGALAVDAKIQGARVVVALSYDEKAETNFMKIVGAKTVALGVETEAVKGIVAGNGDYVDLHIVMDVSAAMGIGATAGDQSTMAGADAALNCALACHTTSVHYAPRNSDTLAAVTALGVETRIDVMRKAVQDALAAARAKAPTGRFRVALYALSNTLRTVNGLTTDIAAAASAAGAVQLAGSIGEGGANLSYGLRQLDGLVAKSGDGASQASAKQIVLLVASGIQNSNKIIACSNAATINPACYGAFANATTTVMDSNWLGNVSPWKSFPEIAGAPVIQPIDPTYCAPLKAKGARMMTLEVEYVVPTVGDGVAEDRLAFIEDILPTVNANMKACASGAADAKWARDSGDVAKTIGSLVDSATPTPGLALHLTK